MKKMHFVIILTIFLLLQKSFAHDNNFMKQDKFINSNNITFLFSEHKYTSIFNLNLTSASLITTDDVYNFNKLFSNNSFRSANPLFGENNTVSDLSELKPYRFGLYVNPLGFLEFGPIIGAEFTLFSHLIIDGHVRFASLGLLMPIISKNEDGVSPYKLEGMGVGGGLKFLFNNEHGGLYLGAIAESAWQTQYFEEGEPWENVGEVEYIGLVSNIGYKFAAESGLYINLGAYLGAAFTTKNEWHYTNSYKGDNSIHISDPATRPFLMIELCFGFDFIKF